MAIGQRQHTRLKKQCERSLAHLGMCTKNYEALVRLCYRVEEQNRGHVMREFPSSYPRDNGAPGELPLERGMYLVEERPPWRLVWRVS